MGRTQYLTVQKWSDIREFRISIYEQIKRRSGISEWTCSWKYTYHYTQSANDMEISFWSCQSVLTQDLNKQHTSATSVLNFSDDEKLNVNVHNGLQEKLQRDSQFTFWLLSFPKTQGDNEEKDEILWYHHNSRTITGCTWQVQNIGLLQMPLTMAQLLHQVIRKTTS